MVAPPCSDKIQNSGVLSIVCMMMPNWPLAICFSLSSSARMHWWTVCQHSPNRNANGNTAILHICPSTMCFSSLQSLTFSGGLFLLAEWGSERALRQRDPFLASSSTQIAFLATIGNLASPIANMVMGCSMRIGMRITCGERCWCWLHQSNKDVEQLGELIAKPIEFSLGFLF